MIITIEIAKQQIKTLKMTIADILKLVRRKCFGSKCSENKSDPNVVETKLKKMDTTEDKTSDNYVPKSYRSQSKFAVFLTNFLDKYLGLRFLQPIKWNNAILIFLLHFIVAQQLLTYKLGSLMWQTYVWGK